VTAGSSVVSPSIGKFLGFNVSLFEREACLVRVCAIAVTPSDRRRGVARSDISFNSTLHPCLPDVFFLLLPSPKRAGSCPRPVR